MKPRKALPRSTKPIHRNPFTRRATPRKRFLLAATKAALDFFFELSDDPCCQICWIAITRSEADPCHKWRRHHGRHSAEDVLAGHRACHTWMDNQAHREREKEAQASPASCRFGGVVQWSPLVKKSTGTFFSNRKRPIKELQ